MTVEECKGLLRRLRIETEVDVWNGSIIIKSLLILLGDDESREIIDQSETKADLPTQPTSSYNY